MKIFINSIVLSFIFAMALHNEVFAQIIYSHQKVLLAVVSLSSNSPKHKNIYKLEERSAAKFIRGKTNNKYDRVIILENENASYTEFKKVFNQILSDPTVSIVDSIIYTHGRAKESSSGASLCFYKNSGCTHMTQIRSDLNLMMSEINNQSNNQQTFVQSKLRALYSDACYSNDHSQYWIDIGFKVTAGSIAKDSNKTADLRSFFQAWFQGKSFSDSIEAANGKLISEVTDFLLKNANSHKQIVGDGDITF